MGTAERRKAPEDGTAARSTALREPEAPDRGIPAQGRSLTRRSGLPAAGAAVGDTAEGTARGTGRTGAAEHVGASRTNQEQAVYRPLWVEEPARRRRLPDPVRRSAVRAVLFIAVTLLQAMVAFLCTLAGSWLALPMVISSVISTVVATWGALDVWVTRQVWNQRNGVVSTPSSTARALRRERRRARRQERTAERAQERIRRRSGAGQLSHS
ncbi:hypothetical protein BM536_019005 [Streptomyces phaeoluteigriseus]|uniref:Uncharacterized protein n=1 Tax=Streptomyces phaeoluteigriseus TaxID=114686 RepID=A0A1V6MRL7_9ACTN|nr:hypothetical protein [Streptomyces phaeoluteigriseus]OQD55035.1 hypothetical protein BM536_019005 [Streptomyces phaeoluteigriseus]